MSKQDRINNPKYGIIVTSGGLMDVGYDFYTYKDRDEAMKAWEKVAGQKRYPSGTPIRDYIGARFVRIEKTNGEGE